MKRTLILTLLLALITMPAFAGKHNVSGVKVDAPDLIKLTKDTTIGVEAGKDVINDLLYPDDYSYVEADKGYFAYIKLTFKGNILDLTQ